MEPIKPTFSEVVYSEMATWIGRTPCKSCNSTVSFAVHGDFAVAAIRTMGRTTVVCCDLDCPEHRHESLGDAGKSTHPNRSNPMPDITGYSVRLHEGELYYGEMVCEDLQHE